MYRSINVVGMSQAASEEIIRVNAGLCVDEHAPDCPVRHGASSDCVWPLAVCIRTVFDDGYKVESEV